MIEAHRGLFLRVDPGVEHAIFGEDAMQSFAWIKAGKLTEEQFAAWHKAAKAKKKDCDHEVISPDEFKAWLKDS